MEQSGPSALDSEPLQAHPQAVATAHVASPQVADAWEQPQPDAGQAQAGYAHPQQQGFMPPPTRAPAPAQPAWLPAQDEAAQHAPQGLPRAAGSPAHAVSSVGEAPANATYGQENPISGFSMDAHMNAQLQPGHEQLRQQPAPAQPAHDAHEADAAVTVRTSGGDEGGGGARGLPGAQRRHGKLFSVPKRDAWSFFGKKGKRSGAGWLRAGLTM